MPTLDDDLLAAAVSEHRDGATIALRVLPRSARTAFAGRYGAAIRLKVQAPPVDGAANEAVVRFVADTLGVARGDVAVVAGQRGRDKVVLVHGRPAAAVRAALAG